MKSLIKRINNKEVKGLENLDTENYQLLKHILYSEPRYRDEKYWTLFIYAFLKTGSVSLIILNEFEKFSDISLTGSLITEKIEGKNIMDLIRETAMIQSNPNLCGPIERIFHRYKRSVNIEAEYWLLCSKRLPLIKDVRLLIADYIRRDIMEY